MQTRQTIAGIVFLLFLLCIGSILWTRSENQLDRKQESLLVYNAIRNFNETGDPLCVAYIYVGSTKTKVFHGFVSECAKNIGSMQLKGFDSKEDAAKAGYARCEVCSQ